MARTHNLNRLETQTEEDQWPYVINDLTMGEVKDVRKDIDEQLSDMEERKHVLLRLKDALR